MRDQLTVGGEEIVIGEFAGENPGGLLKGAGRDVRLGELSHKKVDFEFFGNRGVVMTDTGNFYGLGEGNAELFAEFASEGLSEGFASADLSSGEFPFEGRSVSSAALADEDTAIGTFNDSCDDLEHEWKC